MSEKYQGTNFRRQVPGVVLRAALISMDIDTDEFYKVLAKVASNLFVFGFGKYVGRPMEEVAVSDPGYCSWVLRTQKENNNYGGNTLITEEQMTFLKQALRDSTRQSKRVDKEFFKDAEVELKSAESKKRKTKASKE